MIIDLLQILHIPFSSPNMKKLTNLLETSKLLEYWLICFIRFCHPVHDWVLIFLV